MKHIKKKKRRKAIFILISLFLASLVVNNRMIYYFGNSHPQAVELFMTISKYTLFFLLAYFLIRYSSFSFKKIFGSFSLKNINWLKLMGMNLLLVLFDIPVFAAMMENIPALSMAMPQTALFSQNVPAGYLNSALTVAVAPLIEEIFFRGFLLNRLGKKHSSAFALFLSSAIFSFIQFDGIFTPQLLSGLFFGMTYMKTRKLIVPILLHVMNNATTMLLTYFIGENALSGYALNLTSYLSEQSWVSLVLAPVCLYFLYRYYKKSPKGVPLYGRLRF